MIKRILLSLIVCFMAITGLTLPATADLVSPNFGPKICPLGEDQYVCGVGIISCLKKQAEENGEQFDPNQTYNKCQKIDKFKEAHLINVIKKGCYETRIYCSKFDLQKYGLEKYYTPIFRKPPRKPDNPAANK